MLQRKKKEKRKVKRAFLQWNEFHRLGVIILYPKILYIINYLKRLLKSYALKGSMKPLCFSKNVSPI